MARDSRQFGSTLHKRKQSLDSIKKLMLKSPSRAKGDLLRHLDKYPEDMYAWHFYGRIAQDEYRFEEAEYAFLKVANSNSWNKYAGIVGLGDVARAKGNRQLAKKYYHQAIKENPKESTRTYCILARTEVVDCNYEEALKVLNSCRIQDNSILLEKLKIYVTTADIENASTLAEQIIPNSPLEERVLLHEKAKIAITKKEIERAKYLLELAKEYPIKDIDYYKILRTESNLAVEEKNYQLAIDNCEESLRANQSLNGEVYIILGRTKQMLGEYQTAIDNYRLASIEPSATQAAKQASHLYAALQYLLLDNKQEAENELTEALKCKKRPYDAVVEVLCGIYYRQERYDEIRKLTQSLGEKYQDQDFHTLLNFINLIVDKKTGKDMPERNNRIYRERQIVEYRKQDAVAHIRKHHQSTSQENGNFAFTINISELYDEIQLQLTEDNQVVSTDMLDKYLVDYPNVGYTNEGKIVDKIGVVTLPGTKDIITMYPDYDSYGVRKADIKKMPQIQKTKSQNSRIAKFNERYSKFNKSKN